MAEAHEHHEVLVNLEGMFESIETYEINSPLIFVVIVKPKIYFSKKLEELYSAKEETDLSAKRPTNKFRGTIEPTTHHHQAANQA
jgi:hypothetical protein